MALTDYPVITVNAATGSDSAASGAGPPTAVPVTCSTSTNSTTVTFSNSPDLSGVAQDGTAVLFISGIGFVRISTVDNTAKTCVVETALTIPEGATGGIGGKRATLHSTESLRLFAATASPTASGASGRWSVALEDDQSPDVTIPLAFTSGTGNLQIRSSVAGTRRTITCSASGAAAFTANAINRVSFRDLEFRHSHATKGYAVTVSSSPILTFRSCVCGANDGTNCPDGLVVRTAGSPSLYLYDSAILRGGSIGLNGPMNIFATGLSVSRCTGAGISNGSNSLRLIDCLIAHNGGDGVLNNAQDLQISGCTIDGNAGDGIKLTVANILRGIIHNNSITANTGYGLNVSGAAPHELIVEHNNFGNASDSTNNTLGAANGWTLNATNVTIAPGYADRSASVRNYEPGEALDATALPVPPRTIGAGQSGTKSYRAIGVSQRLISGSSGLAGAVIGSSVIQGSSGRQTMFRPGDSYYGEFTTASAATGAATSATGTPTATATCNGTDDPSFSLTVTNLDTGRYKIEGTIPSGYAAGDVVQISVAATVAGVAGKAVVDSFVIDADPIDLPANIGDMAINVDGQVAIDLVQSVGTTDVGTCLQAAAAQGAGKWVLNTNNNTLTYYLPDGTTVFRVFDVDNVVSPAVRTPQP